MVAEPNLLFKVLMNNSLFGTPVSFSKTAALTKFYQIIIDLKQRIIWHKSQICALQTCLENRNQDAEMIRRFGFLCLI